MNPDHYEFSVGINLLPEEQGIAVLFSGEGKPFPAHKIGPAVHDYYLIHTVLGGKGFFQCGGVDYPCQAGDTFAIFPGSLFSYQADREEPWHYAWVALQGYNAEKLLGQTGLTKEGPLLHSGDLHELSRLYEHIRLSFQQSSYPGLENLEADGWLRLLLHHLGWHNRTALPVRTRELPETIDRQVEQAIRWIALQFNQTISIGQMASSLGYHRAHLSKAFKQRTGMSPKQYLLKVRMEKAEELLKGSLPIEQVASAVGFADALYFSKQFRKWSGMPPSEYRHVFFEK